MENCFYYDSLALKYSRKTGKIYSAKVVFDIPTDDQVNISPKFFEELEKNDIHVSEANQELFFILAKAIQLKEENTTRTISGTVNKYDFESKNEPFAEKFIKRLAYLLKNVQIENIATFFADAKVAYLDYFLNQIDAISLAKLFNDNSFDINTVCGRFSEKCDEYEEFDNSDNSENPGYDWFNNTFI